MDRRLKKMAVLLSAVALVSTLVAGVGPSEAQTTAGVAPTAPTGGKPTDMTARLAAVARPGVADAGAGVQARAAGMPVSGPDSLLRRPDGRLLVDVTLADPSADGLASLADVGAELVAVDDGPVLATVAVAATSLQALADLPAVAYVTEIPAPHTAATRGQADGAARVAPCPTGILTEGDGQLRADLARAAYDVDGTGVEVGVVSDSYNNLGGAAADVAAAELPGPANPCGALTPVGIQSEFGGGGIDEGRAMAQIVHDLAPGAELTVATAFNGELDFANQVIALGVGGADVITDDIYYTSEPMFQDGPVAAAINANRTLRDIPHFTAGGNSNIIIGGKNVGSYEAPAFRPVTCPAGIPGYNNACHDFDPLGGTDAGDGLTLQNGGSISLSLGWSEPMYGVTTDLDLYLVDAATNTAVAGSETDNSLSARPAEALGYVNTSGGPRTYNVVIGRYQDSPNPAGTPRLKHVLVRASGLTGVEWNTSGSGDVVGPTLVGHAAAALAMSTAAVPYDDSTAPETYSSRGPQAICWQPVSGTSPQPAKPACDLVRPDLAATDGGANSFFGSFESGTFRFYGTSAAAPHAAAVAALTRQAFPCADAATVEAALTSSAVPVGAFGVDAVGAGLVDALGALDAVSACPVISTCDDGDAIGPFPDVGPDHPFCADIEWLVDEGLTTGYPDGTFRPAATVTRQALAAMLYRQAGSPDGTDPTCATAPFADVPTTHPFCGEIAWAADTGITTGFPDGTFRPAATVTRQALAAILYRQAGSPDGTDPTCSTAAFTDVPTTHPFCGEIAWAADTGITTGFPDGTFRPAATVTRQALAAFLHRAADLP